MEKLKHYKIIIDNVHLDYLILKKKGTMVDINTALDC